MKKIVLIADSFKGCLTSREVEAAAARGVLAADASCQTLCLPVADGGEGLLEVGAVLTAGHRMEVEVHDPLMRPHRAGFVLSGDGQTAIVEMAEAGGLPLLTREERNPLHTTSYGTGELIARALACGVREVVIGLGGSATNDAGMGMMQALGARFYDREGNVLPAGCGKLLEEVDDIDLSDFYQLLGDVSFAAACDVDNPFCGQEGAACVFAPQKGADAAMVSVLDAGLRHFASVVERKTGKSIACLPGAGAAGGMGGALSAFFQAPLRSGISLVLDKMNFSDKIKDASLIITGEGHADAQTLRGKVAAGVLGVARRASVPVALVAGRVSDGDRLLSAGFQSVRAVTPAAMPLEEALRPEVARKNIECAVEQLIRELRNDPLRK